MPAAQQAAMEASGHRGVIGTREERIFAFQEYVLKSLELPLTLPRGRELATTGPSSIEGTDDRKWEHIPR